MQTGRWTFWRCAMLLGAACSSGLALAQSDPARTPAELAHSAMTAFVDGCMRPLGSPDAMTGWVRGHGFAPTSNPLSQPPPADPSQAFQMYRDGDGVVLSIRPDGGACVVAVRADDPGAVRSQFVGAMESIRQPGWAVQQTTEGDVNSGRFVLHQVGYIIHPDPRVPGQSDRWTYLTFNPAPTAPSPAVMAAAFVPPR